MRFVVGQYEKKLTPYDIEVALLNMGYEQEYLDDIDSHRLKSIYEEEIGEEIEMELPYYH